MNEVPILRKENTRVIDSRPTDDSSIRRRRQCDECGSVYHIREVETLPLIVVKKDNNREPYDRER